VAFCGNDGNVNIEVTPAGQERDQRLGVQLGDYIIVAHVADGAMGGVYEARNAPTKKRVAIKVLHPDVAQDEIAVERFNREYETAAMFDHPHIVKVIDFGETADGSKFLTMEYLVGEELGDLFRDGVARGTGGQPPAPMLRVLAQVAMALDHAHSFGVIHRDLKPDNIYLCKGDDGYDVRLLDFGSVKLQVETGPKLTAFGTTLGSPYYMSPEQAKGLHDVDGRTDVFAMGAILYEALVGKIAFDAPTVAEILMKIVRHQPTPATQVKPSLPRAIDDVIAKALMKDKTKRYETPQQLVEAALAAYGVEGTCAEWAAKGESELAAAIEAATGRAPTPVQAVPVETPADRERAITQPKPSASTPAPKPSSKPAPRPEPSMTSVDGIPGDGGSRLLLFAGLAVGAFVVAGGIAAAVLFFMG
jgi:serine/threonine protein kinase